MTQPDLTSLLRKLESNCALSEDDREAVLALPFVARTVPPASYLFREGEPPKHCSVLLAGYVFRHKIVGEGGRQIVAINIPGDAIDLQGLYLNCTDHNAQTLTEAVLGLVPMTAMRKLVEERPRVARAVLSHVLVEASIMREWITNIGRRDARTRLSHLLCEFACRVDAQGLGRRGYELPMTQEQIGDVLGLTPVHVNRSIRALEADGLIRRSGRVFTIPNIDRLRRAGDFSSLYLHLHKESAAQGPATSAHPLNDEGRAVWR